jgi:hypothetical protein
MTMHVNMSIMIMAKQQVTICGYDCLLVCVLGLFVCLRCMVTICVSATKLHHCCDHLCIGVFAWMVAWIVCLSVWIVVLYCFCMCVCVCVGTVLFGLLVCCCYCIVAGVCMVGC